jgi:hypothetical protein
MSAGTDFWNKPCATPPLTSYRYKGKYGWIMVGAKDHEEALEEAQWSTILRVERQYLEVWDGERYVPA